MRWPTSSDYILCRWRWWITALLGIWLAAWVWWSWPAMQDDALIHLRYADNLRLHHFITYDGVHSDYGASSLLYVGVLALLRGMTASAELPRAVSSVVHLLLFCVTAFWINLRLPENARTPRLAGFALLVLLASPSAVRWLDDGMETGVAVAIVTLLAGMIHAQVMRERTGMAAKAGASLFLSFFLFGAMAFLAVLLRTELLLVCVVGALILLLEQLQRPGNLAGLAAARSSSGAWATVSILVGAAAAIGGILATMHVLLPDTALAKSEGIAHWLNPVKDTATTLASAFSFGAGMLAFWLLTLWLVLRRTGARPPTLLANCFCPAVVALSALRGQKIQGVRYLAWTFAFSIVWNLLELAREERNDARFVVRSEVLFYVFLGLVALEMPVESAVMHRVLGQRAETVQAFESQRLEVLRSRRGVASDIGLIGYFSGADICDLSGLVNGRASARMTSEQRVTLCAQTKPEFLFVDESQLRQMQSAMTLAEWKVCGRYSFANLRTDDVHYLFVRSDIAEDTCQVTGIVPVPMKWR